MECNNQESFTSRPELNLSMYKQCSNGRNGNRLLASLVRAGSTNISTGSGYGLHRNAAVNSVMTVSLQEKGYSEHGDIVKKALLTITKIY